MNDSRRWPHDVPDRLNDDNPASLAEIGEVSRFLAFCILGTIAFAAAYNACGCSPTSNQAVRDATRVTAVTLAYTATQVEDVCIIRAKMLAAQDNIPRAMRLADECATALEGARPALLALADASDAVDEATLGRGACAAASALSALTRGLSVAVDAGASVPAELSRAIEATRIIAPVCKP